MRDAECKEQAYVVGDADGRGESRVGGGRLRTIREKRIDAHAGGSAEARIDLPRHVCPSAEGGIGSWWKECVVALGGWVFGIDIALRLASTSAPTSTMRRFASTCQSVRGSVVSAETMAPA